MAASARPRTVVAGISIERDVEMRTRDGVVLRSDIYRPAETTRALPVLLLRTPYSKAMPDDATYLHPGWYARHGFIVVAQDVRGRYASDGTFEPFVHEGPDGYDAIEWAAGLTDSNRRVGMYGASYPGSLQLQAAVEQPPSLGAIAPAVTAADLYRHWMYEGGALALSFVAWWASSLASVDAARNRRSDLLARLATPLTNPGPWFGSAAPIDLDPLPDAAPYYEEWLAHPSPDAYWDALGTDTRLDRISVPALHIAGWYDVFLAGGIEAWQKLSRLGAPGQQLLIGPWAHYPWGPVVGSRSFGRAAQGTGLVDDAQVRFFRRHLDPEGSVVKVAAEPIPDAPSRPADMPVRYFVLFEDAWRTAVEWPPSETSQVALYLHGNGAANGVGGDGRLEFSSPAPSEPDVYNYLPTFVVPAAGGHSCCLPSLVPMGSMDNGSVEGMAQVLVYTTDPLSEDLVLAGPVDVGLWVASDAVSADYTAKLCVVDDCCSWNIAEGIARVPPTPEREPLAEPRLVSVSLRHVSARVRAGQRIRLHVTSGTFPTWDTNPQTGASPERTAAEDGRAAMHVVFHDPDHPSCLMLTTLPG